MGTRNLLAQPELSVTESLTRQEQGTIIYVLLKDLPIPGIRIGFTYSFIETVGEIFSFFSSDPMITGLSALRLMVYYKILEGKQKENSKKKLCDSTVAGSMKQLKVKWTESSAGFYCWEDMSGLNTVLQCEETT